MKNLLNTLVFMSAILLSFTSSALSIHNLSNSEKEVSLDIRTYDDNGQPYLQRASHLIMPPDEFSNFPVEIPIEVGVNIMIINIHGEDFAYEISPYGCEIKIYGNKQVEHSPSCGHM